MTVNFTDLRDHNATDVNGFALQIGSKAPLVLFLARHTVVADERVCKREDLPTVTGVRHALGVACHSGVKDDFSICINNGTKAFAGKAGAVAEDELGHESPRSLLEDGTHGQLNPV